ncbi:pantoate--beta-alanine ligase [Rhodocaloribacter litoris]|uniref:pantoate--beta-alanine ligase n=1 Tax=Rhodocaloribacter litoris TaxID=2558931 RepID=UPI001421D26B|nr:pantoate--beta-alanine ligase [Rhodocaloribacter litoris]QXD16077.1 pantoate--beta-alanine ligase [Rhodocaloribacter litoris]GIV59811.1 MAG: pantothenate synthetase [Rhodothermaceae bacterium]
MKLIRTVEAMQAEADGARRAGRRLALVPTMGALHEAHLALVREARHHADHLTVSIFVNPTQFAPGEDFDRYPRTLEADLEKLEALGGVEVVFAPDERAMYPGGQAAHRTWVVVQGLDEHLCGRFRPGHFRGVATVVAKLFLACKPHVAVFGLKDAQQFLILRRMVHDLNFDVEMVGVPTVREPDGLALSSRNVYLTPEERAQAVVLSRAVEEARRLAGAGEQRVTLLVEAMRRALAEAPLARVQYAEVVDAETLQPVDLLQPGREALAAVAVFFGNTRLIDNAFIRVPPG